MLHGAWAARHGILPYQGLILSHESYCAIDFQCSPSTWVVLNVDLTFFASFTQYAEQGAFLDPIVSNGMRCAAATVRSGEAVHTRV